MVLHWLSLRFVKQFHHAVQINIVSIRLIFRSILILILFSYILCAFNPSRMFDLWWLSPTRR